MNDDYLWDRSGEADPEVERLEQVLGKYRYQPRPLTPALRSQFSWHRKPWVRIAAVAVAAMLIVAAGLWLVALQKRAIQAPQEIRATGSEIQPQTAPKNDQPQKVQTAPQKELPTTEQQNRVSIAATSPRSLRRTPRVVAAERPAETRPVEEMLPVDSTVIAERQPIMNPFIDVETARHIERAQLLLRSFRNTSDSGSRIDAGVSYDKKGSRELLSRNILLRRDAEAKGNLPVEELLGSLEPFLLDIANLPDKPSNNELRSIKERMQKKEIVSALQIYSAPTLSQVF